MNGHTSKMIGKKFGLLTVIKHIERKKGYLCRCDCGKETNAKSWMLKQGKHKSCGCQKFLVEQENPSYSGIEELSGSHWCAIRNRAKRRGIIFNITLKEAWDLFLKQDKKCRYTQLPLQFGSVYREIETTASLDRINSLRGYEKDNVQWVHKKVNVMKWNLSEEEFIAICKLIANKN